MLFTNNNRAITRKLSARYLKAGKSRNIIAIIAITLTTILFTTIFTLGSGLLDTVHDQNIRRAGADGQAVLSYVSDEVWSNIKDNALIDRIAYTKAVSYRLHNSGFEKWRVEMWYMDDTALEFSRYVPTTGKRPTTENEIMADTRTLDALGVPAKIGETVSLKYEIKGKEYTADFTLCGFWETDSLSNVGCLVVSEAFIESNSDILAYTYPEDNDYSGVVNVYIMFRGNSNLEQKLQQLLAETGYVNDDMGGNAEDGNYVKARISPVYQSNGLFDNPALFASGLAGLLLIMVTGFLIIYNIFQISVIQDIQSYGQLKTLGTTKRQIKSLINRQAALLSLFGVPIGLLAGFLIGRALVPSLMNGTQFTADAGVKVSVNPLIFIGSAIFAFATVYISVRKPAKIAGSVSPVEAVRYTENDASVSDKKTALKKKSVTGAKIHRMALANLGRNRKRTVLAIVSMMLSLILLNTVFTLSSGFDIDKYVSKFVNTDFVISTADYFRFRFEQSDGDLSQSFINAVKQQDSFKDGGKLYASRALEEGYSVESQYFTNYNKDENGNPLVDLYGADDFLLRSMEVIEGEIDWEKLKSGNYVLLGMETDDNGNIIENPGVNVGDRIKFNHIIRDDLTSEITDSFELIVMAKVRINVNTDTTRTTGAARFYLPAEIFLPICDKPHIASFPFNTKEGRDAEMEDFLSAYTESVEPSMDFDSKETYIRSFNDLTSLIVTLGGVLSLITGLIGIVNFVNSILTSMITRRKEFAALRSIGMTGKQLRRMLTYEGLYYAAGTILVSAVLGTLFSAVIVRAVANGVWFFTYQFVVWPMLVIYPFLIVLTAAIPAILYRSVAKVSIIERLRQN